MQIVVLGMHRSGTSAVSRLINMMGAYAGRAEKIGKPASDNAKGFWEHSEVRDLNDRILASLDSSWDDIVQANLDQIEPEQRSSLLDSIRDFVFEMDTVRPWVIKDPRLSVTLGMWKEALEAPLYIIPYRTPEAVAASLYVRNGIPEVVGMALWEEYLHRALESTQGCARFLVSYEHLLEDPVRIVGDLFRWLTESGSTGLRLPSATEVRGFISGDLRHHRHSYSGIGSSDVARRLFERLDAREDVFSDWSPSASAKQLLQWQHESRRRSRVGDPTVHEGVRHVPSMPEAVGGSRDVLDRIDSLRQDLGRDVLDRIDSLRQDLGDLRHRLDNSIEELHEVRRENSKLRNSNQSLQEANASLASAVSDGFVHIGQAVAEIQENTNQRLQEQLRSDQEAKETVARRLLRQCAAELSGIRNEWVANARSAREMAPLLAAVRNSMRWRIGNAVCTLLERLMLRRQPKLAIDRVVQIAAGFESTFRSERQPAGPLVEHLLEVLGTGDLLGDDVFDSELTRMARRLPERGCLDVIFFPVIDWHFRVQRPQHLARELGAKGHRVFYLETVLGTGSESANYEVLESPAANVFLVRLHTTLKKSPNIYKDVLDDHGSEVVGDALGRLVKDMGIDSPAAIIDLPFWGGVAKSISGTVTAYDCMDHHAGFSTNDHSMLCLEDQLIRDADLVVVTSDWLESEVGKKRSVHLIRNGAEVQRFGERVMADQTADTSRPRIGYIGAISDWFDIDLIGAVAKKMPEADFILVGDVTQIDVSAVATLPNVEFVGEVPYELAPSYVQSFDVCTIPFRICELTLATNPVKAYEYLSAGKPVVATPLPELERMDGMVTIAADAQSFETALRKACSETDAGAGVKRKRWVARHDWSERANDLVNVILGRFPKISVVVLAWNNLEFTQACLASIDGYTRYPDVELVIVDNGSTDGTPDFLRAFAASREHVKLILNEENLGFAAGNNVGLREATGEYVVVLNNDTYVTPGWLQGLVGHLMRNPDLGIIGPVTNNIGNEARIDINYSNMSEMLEAAAVHTRKSPRVLMDVDVVAFFCCAFRRTLLDDIGYLDEQFGRGFFEDDDYCRRIAQKGLRVAIAEDVFVHHHLSASFETLDQAERSALFEDNKRRYEAKWGEWKVHEYRKESR